MIKTEINLRQAEEIMQIYGDLSNWMFEETNEKLYLKIYEEAKTA